MEALNPVQRKLIEESEDISKRVFTLKDITRRPTFAATPIEDRNLVHSQLRAMERYLDFVDQRIKRFKPDWS